MFDLNLNLNLYNKDLQHSLCINVYKNVGCVINVFSFYLTFFSCQSQKEKHRASGFNEVPKMWTVGSYNCCGDDIKFVMNEHRRGINSRNI